MPTSLPTAIPVATWPAIITLLNVLLLVWVAMIVGKARGTYGVKAPAVTGDPAFERAYRVQMNTLESSVVFLPALWLAAATNPGLVPVVAGLVWLAGRVLYALTYLKDAARRGTGFGISFAAFAVLFVDAAIGVARQALA